MYPESRRRKVLSLMKRGEKLSAGFRRRNAERILAGHEIAVIFGRSQAGEIPLGPFIIVIVGSDVDHLMDMRKAGTGGQVDVVEEALLGCVASAVGPAEHGLGGVG